LKELVQALSTPNLRYVYRMVGDYESALDLTQRFYQDFGSLSPYRPEFKFSTWIYKIAHNAAIDHLPPKRRPRTISPMERER